MRRLPGAGRRQRSAPQTPGSARADRRSTPAPHPRHCRASDPWRSSLDLPHGHSPPDLPADLRLTQLSLVTVTAVNVALQTDSVPHLHTAHATAYRIHNATDLMAKHDRQLHEARDVRHPPVNMHIGPAHAGGCDLDAD